MIEFACTWMKGRMISSRGDLDGPDEHLQGAPGILAQLRDPRAAEQRLHQGEAPRLQAGGGQHVADAVLRAAQIFQREVGARPRHRGEGAKSLAR